MNRTNNLNNYKKARIALITAIVFTIINCVLVYLLEDFTLVFAIALPQLAIQLMDFFVEQGYSEILVVILYCVLPLAFYGACYIISKKKTKWLLAATILYCVDALILVVAWAGTGFDSSMLFELVFEGWILISLIKGAKAGKELKDDLSEEKQETIVKKDKKAKIYKYNKEFAQQNGAVKTKLYIVYWLSFILIAAVSTFISSKFTEETSVLAIYLLFGATLGVMAIMFFRLLKIIPYLNVKLYSYYRIDDNLYRVIEGMENTPECFMDIKFAEECKDCYKCSYNNGQKNKELIVPKAYPNIQQILQKK